MPVFISYSHVDRDFVNNLGIQLSRHKTRVWIDKWELNVGDSITDRIQDAIKGSEAILIVLSKASIESDWCRKELSYGIIRELEEKRVIVLPVLIEDCDIPPFLKDKLYADFRTNFDKGLGTLLDAIAKITSNTQGRILKDKYQTDWGIDWNFGEDALRIDIVLVEHSQEFPYTILTQIAIEANESATNRFRLLAENGFDSFGLLTIFSLLEGYERGANAPIVLTDATAQSLSFTAYDRSLEYQFDIRVTCRWLGEDVGKDIVYYFGNQFKNVLQSTLRNTPKPSEEEMQRLMRLLKEYPA